MAFDVLAAVEEQLPGFPIVLHGSSSVPQEYDAKTAKKRWKEYSAQQMTELAEVLDGIEDFSIEGQEPVVLKWVEDKGYKLGDVMNAFRLTLVGEGKGPGMFDISAFLGKEETLRRLRKAIEVLG